MQKLYMSDEEIARSYRGAMNKDAHIGILAELNAVNRTVMRNKLVALGLVQGKIEPIPEPKKPAIERIDEAEARTLIGKGVNDEQIARHFGVGITTFQSWRRAKGIMRYPGKMGGKTTVKEGEKAMTEQKSEETAVEQTAASEEKTVDAEGMKVGDFLAMLTELLTPGLAKASLLLNGESVRAVAELRLRSRGGNTYVDVRWEG